MKKNLLKATFSAFLSVFIFLFCVLSPPFSSTVFAEDTGGETTELLSSGSPTENTEEPEPPVLESPDTENILTDDISSQPEEILTGESAEITPDANGLPIYFKDGLHYILDPEYPGEPIVLFCMNNMLNWPHHTEGMGNTQVPDYINGYLGPEDFKSEADYRECMRRLSKILYAGYPYNAEGLYKIVEDPENYTLTVEQFNAMLVTPPVLQTAFPVLGHHDFLLSDWENQSTNPNAAEHMEQLHTFTEAVMGLQITGGTTSNGLTASDIMAMPFYQAAFCMIYDDRISPLETFANSSYAASYFVTKAQAYDATQYAVWYLLTQYGIPDNNLVSLDTPLGERLYLYSERGGLLEREPSASELHLTGDLKFTYNPKDGMWHSGKLMLKEPEEYRGLYRLNLPEGWSAKCDHLTYVYGNEEYELTSDHQPKDGESFGIEADFIWQKDMRQYSPASDIEVDGKKFQHMIGSVIRKTKITANIPIGVTEVGSIAITKTVEYDEDSQKEFNFTLKLPYHTEINGQYGDLQFHNGVAEFTLKNNQTLTAANLPASAEYKITEEESGEYITSSLNDHGTITANEIQKVTFTNTRLHNLTLGKKVTGNMGDTTKNFTFIIQLTDETGQPFTGSLPYKGSVQKEFENQVTAPENGTLNFQNGTAEIQLSHGQQITIENLHPAITYQITEKEANEDGYTTAYPDNISGNLNADQTILIVNDKIFVPDTGISDFAGTGGILIFAGITGVLLLAAEYILRLRRGIKK